jgi:response regulator RpfG family c-di-GMP phosphodiesterase
MYDRGIRISRYASLIGELLGLTEEAATDLASAATLHEMGGIETPNPEDLQVSPMGRDSASLLQPERAARILSHVPELRDVAEIIRFYEENFDGSGSPRNLVGEQIPLSSRILRVAHEYDQMTSPRNSARTLSHAEAAANLAKQSGEVFDPIVVHTFALVGLAELSDPYSIKFDESNSDFEFSTTKESISI